jgi:hypothetical protein
MKKLLILFAITGYLYQPSMAQSIKTPAPSAPQYVKQDFGLSAIELSYSRPNVKGRKIFGDLVPFGKVWRTGADEATLLITQKPIIMGGTTIPAGAYTLFTLPAEDGSAKLIINKQIGQWGIGPGSYDEKQDLARIDLKKDTLDKPVDQFTMAVTKAGDLKMMWDNVQYSVSFTVQK